MAPIEVLHITAANGLHHLRQPIRRAGRGQQVEMVVHQHVGVDGHLKLARLLFEQGQHGLEVRPVHKDRLAVVAALDDVVRVAGQSQSGQASHGWCGTGGDWEAMINLSLISPNVPLVRLVPSSIAGPLGCSAASNASSHHHPKEQTPLLRLQSLRPAAAVRTAQPWPALAPSRARWHAAALRHCVFSARCSAR